MLVGHRRHGSVHGKFLRHVGNRAVEALIPSQFLTRVGTHATHDGRHAALGANLGFVDRIAAANAREQVVVLLLIRIGVRASIFEFPRPPPLDGVFGTIAMAERASNVL